MKKLIYIFIPILAILLMSHNTYASGQILTDYSIRTTSGTWQVYSAFNDGFYEFDNVTTSTGFCGIITLPDAEIEAGKYIKVDLITFNTVFQPVGANSGITSYHNAGTKTSVGTTLITSYNNNSIIDSTSSRTGGNYNGYSMVYRLDDDYNTADNSICFTFNINSQPVLWLLDLTYGQTLYLSRASISVYDNESQAIADAVNAPEEQAADDIENQSTSDIDTGDDSSATNLIGNINTLFTQIGNIQASNTCSVPADFGNLDLGNINFCTGKDKLPFVVTFGAYAFELVFVVGTAIILVKQVLGLFDWARS